MFVSCVIRSESDVYGQAASNLVAGSNLEVAIQQILDMGGGTWDRDMVVRALRAAYNNPERAVDYLYSVSFIYYSYHSFKVVALWHSQDGEIISGMFSVFPTSARSLVQATSLLFFVGTVWCTDQI